MSILNNIGGLAKLMSNPKQAVNEFILPEAQKIETQLLDAIADFEQKNGVPCVFILQSVTMADGQKRLVVGAIRDFEHCENVDLPNMQNRKAMLFIDLVKKFLSTLI